MCVCVCVGREDRCVGSCICGCWGRSQPDVLGKGEEAGKVKEAIWLDVSFSFLLFICLTALGLSCSMRDLAGSRGIFSWWHMDSVVACGI